MKQTNAIMFQEVKRAVMETVVKSMLESLAYGIKDGVYTTWYKMQIYGRIIDGIVSLTPFE